MALDVDRRHAACARMPGPAHLGGSMSPCQWCYGRAGGCAHCTPSASHTARRKRSRAAREFAKGRQPGSARTIPPVSQEEMEAFVKQSMALIGRTGVTIV